MPIEGLLLKVTMDCAGERAFMLHHRCHGWCTVLVIRGMLAIALAAAQYRSIMGGPRAATGRCHPVNGDNINLLRDQIVAFSLLLYAYCHINTAHGEAHETTFLSVQDDEDQNVYKGYNKTNNGSKQSSLGETLESRITVPAIL